MINFPSHLTDITCAIETAALNLLRISHFIPNNNLSSWNIFKFLSNLGLKCLISSLYNITIWNSVVEQRKNQSTTTYQLTLYFLCSVIRPQIKHSSYLRKPILPNTKDINSEVETTSLNNPTIKQRADFDLCKWNTRSTSFVVSLKAQYSVVREVVFFPRHDKGGIMPLGTSS
jgi:hypothetical protein